MIKHIVMWRVQSENRSQKIEAMKSRLEALPALIPEIVEYEVGLNFNGSERAMDLVLISSFANREDLTTYSNHPAHQEVVQFIRTVSEHAGVVDYEI